MRFDQKSAVVLRHIAVVHLSQRGRRSTAYLRAQEMEGRGRRAPGVTGEMEGHRTAGSNRPAAPAAAALFTPRDIALEHGSFAIAILERRAHALEYRLRRTHLIVRRCGPFPLAGGSGKAVHLFAKHTPGPPTAAQMAGMLSPPAADKAAACGEQLCIVRRALAALPADAAEGERDKLARFVANSNRTSSI